MNKDFEDRIHNKILQRQFVIVKWPVDKNGLDYSIIKRDYCSKFKITTRVSSISLSCTVNLFGLIYICEIVKAGTLKNSWNSS